MKILSRCSLLIVDSNRHFCDTLAEVIAPQLAKVASCQSLAEAQTLCLGQEQGFDVILWDATLPPPPPGLAPESYFIKIAAEFNPQATGPSLSVATPWDGLQKPFPPSTLLSRMTGIGSRILLLSGNEMDYNLLSRRLTAPKAKIEVSDNGWQALGLIEKNRFDLIIADTELCSVQSSHFLFQVRKRYSSLALPIILITDQHQRDRVAAGLAQGANDFISRPYDFLTVNARIQAQLANKHGELELSATKDYALGLAETKSRFLANMSHEIRTPLNGIIGMTSLLTTTTLTSEQDKLAKIIQSSGSSLLSIVGDILDFSKIEAGKMEPENTAYSLEALIEQTAAGFADSAASAKLMLVSHVAPDLPPRLRGAPGWIGQILSNFISNAIKFTATGKVEIAAFVTAAKGTAASAEEPRPVPMSFSRHLRQQLAITVKDTGKGLGADYEEWLFKPFTQEDRSTTRNYGGTGLGLAICQRLVHLMGGRIGVSSKPGEGSTFWFTVPLSPAPGLYSLKLAPSAKEGLLAVVTPHRHLTESIAAATAPLAITTVAITSVADLGHDSELSRFDYILIDCDWPDWSRLVDRVSTHQRATALRGFVLCQIGQPLPLPHPWQVVDKPLAMHTFIRKLLGQANPLKIVSEPDNPKQEAAALPRGQVLVVEDNPTNQLVTTKMLAKLGIGYEVAEHGKEALAKLEQSRSYDLVLMDGQMPVMDGYKATAAIRDREQGTGKRIPIIAMTASAMAEDRQACLDAGMDGYLAKPVSITTLSEILSRWLPSCKAA